MPICSDWATASLTIQGQPQISLAVVSISSPVTPGQYASAQIRVTNSGTAPGTVTVTGDTYDLSGVRQGGWTSQTVQVGPGQSTTVVLSSLGPIHSMFAGQTLRAVFRADGATASATFQVAQVAPPQPAPAPSPAPQPTPPPSGQCATLRAQYDSIRAQIDAIRAELARCQSQPCDESYKQMLRDRWSALAAQASDILAQMNALGC